jgi:hypothetical protein
VDRPFWHKCDPGRFVDEIAAAGVTLIDCVGAREGET